MTRFTREDHRTQLAELYGNKCFYCPVEFDDDTKMTIDHFIPQEFGRKNGWTEEEIWDIDNLRPACRSCNVLKGNTLPDEDGTVVIPERRVRVPKAERPAISECCNSGREIWPGERCQTCGSGAMPSEAPTAIQVKPRDCDHSAFHCWACMALGIVPRKSAAWWLLTGDEVE